MKISDQIRFSYKSVLSHRLSSFLTLLGITIGITAVVLLTSIGEGIHRFVLSEFTQFGTKLVAINPGRATTHGVSVGVFGTERPLSLDDAAALQQLSFARAVVPFLQGNAEVEAQSRQRRTTIYGAGPAMPETFQFRVASGSFLPRDNPASPRALAVLGSKVRRELFGNANPLGQRIRIGGYRYRIVGVMEPKGDVLGFDLDDAVYIPAARAMEMFNRNSLMEIDMLYQDDIAVEKVVAGIRRTLISRHGREDFTITTQEQMLDVLGSVLNILTFAVGALGGISLLVGSVGILTIMTISVTERTAEIGLLRALGGDRLIIVALFLGEAIFLAGIGGILGMGLGVGGAWLLHFMIPELPVHTPWSYVIMAEILAILIGLLSGILPALRAAHLDPVDALRSE